jgi:hypothetical protein
MAIFHILLVKLKKTKVDEQEEEGGRGEKGYNNMLT